MYSEQAIKRDVRAVRMLRKEGYKFREIAAAFGRSQYWVLSRYHYGVPKYGVGEKQKCVNIRLKNAKKRLAEIMEMAA